MNWKIIWRSFKHDDMRKRILAVLGMIVVFRMLAQIPIPLADPTTLRELLDTLFTATHGSGGLLNFLDVLSGGALSNFSILLIGLGPYINASIIMQLLTQAIPKLEALNKEGEYGRKKINQITRMLTVPLAIIGITAGLLSMNVAFGFMGLLGSLSLVGLLIKNAIVLIEEIDMQIDDGKESYTAILDSSVSRLRPVMMAASTTILGMAPLLSDVFFLDMAVVIMFGLGFASVLTLIVVPVLYAIFFNIKVKA